MNNKIKKFGALAVALLLILSTVACTNSAAPASADPVENSSGTADSAEADPAPSEGQASAEPAAAGAASTDGAAASSEFVPVPQGEWNVPYETPVHISTVSGVGNDWLWQEGDDMHNNAWVRGWKKDLNIEVTYDWLDAGSAEYDTKLNMSIASQTLPDTFSVNYQQFRQLMKAEAVMDITDYYNNNLSQRVRDYELTDPDTIKTAMQGDRIYGVPNYYYGIIDAPRHLWVRNDWYKEYGSPEIKTVAQMEDMARHFMDTYGGYGINISNTLEWLFFTGPMFDVYLGNPHNPTEGTYFWYPDDSDGGRLKAGIAHPEFKTALEYWAKWYSEGILSPDFTSKDDAAAHEDIVNGLTGIQPWWQWQGWMNGPNLVGAQSSDEAYMVPLNLPTVTGDQVLGQVGFSNASIKVINKDCQNPVAVMKLLSYTDYMKFDPECKLSAEDFEAFFGGQREHACGNAFSIIDPQADMLQYESVTSALQTGDESVLINSGMQKKYADAKLWIDSKDPAGLGAYLQQGFDGCSYYNSKLLIDGGFIKRTSMWGPAPEEFDQTANTADIIAMGVTSIIIGAEPVAYFDQVLEEWYAAGGQIMEDAVNQYYGG